MTPNKALLPLGIWSAAEAISWGMFEDKSKLSADGSTNNGAPTVSTRSYNDTRRQLRDAIAVGQVTARGFRLNDGVPALSRETLPQEMFQRFRFSAIDLCGEVTFMHPGTPQLIPAWHGIVFEEQEIRALWPAPRPDLDQWMVQAAQSRPDEKRDTRISDCVSATGCKNREAMAAYNRLPDGLKRKRGHRIKPTVIKSNALVV